MKCFENDQDCETGGKADITYGENSTRGHDDTGSDVEMKGGGGGAVGDGYRRIDDDNGRGSDLVVVTVKERSRLWG